MKKTIFFFVALFPGLLFAAVDKCVPTNLTNVTCPAYYSEPGDCSPSSGVKSLSGWTSVGVCSYDSPAIYENGNTGTAKIRGNKVGECSNGQKVSPTGQCTDPEPTSPPEGAVGPDENGDCAPDQTKTDGWCVPNTPPPTPGDMVPQLINCGPGVDGKPKCDFSEGPKATNCGGWNCTAYPDDYIPVSAGGGCYQYQGTSDWWCMYNAQINGVNTSSDPVSPLFKPTPVVPGSNHSTKPPTSTVTSTNPNQTTTYEDNEKQVTVTNTENQQEVYVYDRLKNNYEIRTTNSQTGEYSTQSGSGPGPGPGSTLGTGAGTGSGSGTSQGGYSQCHDTFSCSGDAVQCGIAKSLFDMRCAHNIPEDVFDANNIYGSISPSDAEKALNKDGLFDFDILAAFNDKRKAYLAFSSGCMGSVSIPVFGTQVVADLTVLCELGTVIKFLFHIAAYLLCIRIIHATLV